MTINNLEILEFMLIHVSTWCKSMTLSASAILDLQSLRVVGVKLNNDLLLSLLLGHSIRILFDKTIEKRNFCYLLDFLFVRGAPGKI